MKIVHINGVYGVLSTGRLVQDLVEYGNEKGHISKAFYSEGYTDSHNATRFITDVQRKKHALLSRISGLQGYWSKGETNRLIAELDKFGPDVVHLHVLHGNCINLNILFRYLQEKKVATVITLHDCWWFTGRCAHPLAYNCDGYTLECRDCPARADVCPSWFWDRANKMLHDKANLLRDNPVLCIVGVSDWIAQQAKKSFMSDFRIEKIYNWVDLTAFCPQNAETVRERNGLVGKKVVLGVASLWTKEKGIHDFIELAQLLPEHYQIIMIGNVKEGWKLPNSIIHIPHTDSKQELAEYYSLAEVYVNASRMETFGLTIAEALACGTPTIVYDSTACPELVFPGTGFIVKQAEGINGLIDKVQRIIKTDSVSMECVRQAKLHFSRNKGCEEYLNIYESLIC